MKCSRCGGLAYEEIIDFELYLRCWICGACTPTIQIINGIVITITNTATKDTLPRRGSKLSVTLGALAGVEKGTTRQISDKTGQSSNDTASQLTVLQGRGLVIRMNHKRGVEGGSTWSLSPLAITLLGI